MKPDDIAVWVLMACLVFVAIICLLILTTEDGEP